MICSASLMRLHQVVVGIEVQQRHEPAVDASRFDPVAALRGRIKATDSRGKALVSPDTQPLAPSSSASSATSSSAGHQHEAIAEAVDDVGEAARIRRTLLERDDVRKLGELRRASPARCRHAIGRRIVVQHDGQRRWPRDRAEMRVQLSRGSARRPWRAAASARRRRSSRRRARNSAARSVVSSETPATSGTRPPTASTAATSTVRFSSGRSELFSPTVPSSTRPSTPSSTSAVTTFCVASTSRLSSRRNCVVLAGKTPDHFFIVVPLLEAAQIECGDMRGQGPAGDQIGDGVRGDGGQREADVLVTKGIHHVGGARHPPDGG